MANVIVKDVQYKNGRIARVIQREVPESQVPALEALEALEAPISFDARVEALLPGYRRAMREVSGLYARARLLVRLGRLHDVDQVVDEAGTVLAGFAQRVDTLHRRG